MGDVNTGSNAILRMESWITYTDVGGNYNNYHWKLSLIERSPGGYGWSTSTPASVNVYPDNAGSGVLWSGNFGFDFRPGGQQSVVIAEGDYNGIGNYPDGNPRGVTFRGLMGDTGTSTAGGPASVDAPITPPATIVIPGKPSNLYAVRNSDNQVDLHWNQNNAGNGQPIATAIDKKVNNGSFQRILDISNVSDVATGGHGANQKLEFRVIHGNAAGWSAWSDTSAPIYTTPGTSTNVTAAKDASLNIVVSFTSTVAYAEHNHEVWHGVVSGGVTTWDSTVLATLASGITSYTHVSPDPSKVHTYRVRAKSSSSLFSAYAQSGVVQLIVAPNAPTVPPFPTYANYAGSLPLTWIHNSQDTTPQTAAEIGWSTDGGSTWDTTGKMPITYNSMFISGGAFASGSAVTFRVRTWGAATTGGSEDTGASPWSLLRTVIFKTAPTTTISTPASGSTISDATLRVTVTFSQPEGAQFVKARLSLLTGGTEIETLDSTIQTGITMSSVLANGASYTVIASVQDSNGLWSIPVANSFSVAYLPPSVPTATLKFLPESGFAQIDVTIGNPDGTHSSAVSVSITRTIKGSTENVVVDYGAAPALTFMDTIPVINGSNSYVITTKSALGAVSSITATLVTTELRRAYLSKGSGYNIVAVFGGNLKVDESLSVATDTIQAAGRTKPIGLYGVETSVQVKVKSRIYEGLGSTIPEIRAILLVPGKACYRDPSGRRVFGSVKGSVSYNSGTRGDLSFTLTETS